VFPPFKNILRKPRGGQVSPQIEAREWIRAFRAPSYYNTNVFSCKEGNDDFFLQNCSNLHLFFGKERMKKEPGRENGEKKRLCGALPQRR